MLPGALTRSGQSDFLNATIWKNRREAAIGRRGPRAFVDLSIGGLAEGPRLMVRKPLPCTNLEDLKFGNTMEDR